MQAEGSLPHSQVATTCPYPEPAPSGQILRYTSVFVYSRQLEFAILQLQMLLKNSSSGLDGTVEDQIVR